MTTGLTTRLQEIPGVASVAVDLTDSGGGINVRLEPGADETLVMDTLRSVLVAYGVRSPSPPKLRPHQWKRSIEGVDLGVDLGSDLGSDLGVDVAITPIDEGARIEVATKNVRSFRVVAATPVAIAQGLADAWCQVIPRVPIEVADVGVDDQGTMTVSILDEGRESQGSANVASGWEDALAQAVGMALQGSQADVGESTLVVNS